MAFDLHTYETANLLSSFIHSFNHSYLSIINQYIWMTHTKQNIQWINQSFEQRRVHSSLKSASFPQSVHSSQHSRVAKQQTSKLTTVHHSSVQLTLTKHTPSILSLTSFFTQNKQTTKFTLKTAVILGDKKQICLNEESFLVCVNLLYIKPCLWII